MRVPLAGPCQRRSRRQAAPTSRGLPGTVLAFPARPAAAPPFPTPPGRTRDRSRQPGRRAGPRASARPAHAGWAAAARPPQPLPPRPWATVWSPLTAPRPADAASSCASTLPYQSRGGAPASSANRRQPRPRRAGPRRGQGEGDWAAAALGAWRPRAPPTAGFRRRAPAAAAAAAEARRVTGVSERTAGAGLRAVRAARAAGPRTFLLFGLGALGHGGPRLGGQPAGRGVPVPAGPGGPAVRR